MRSSSACQASTMVTSTALGRLGANRKSIQDYILLPTPSSRVGDVLWITETNLETYKTSDCAPGRSSPVQETVAGRQRGANDRDATAGDPQWVSRGISARLTGCPLTP